MTNDAERVSDSLREYTKMKYIGDCKCGQCQLVPLAVIIANADIIEAQSKALAEARVNSVMLEEISDALDVAVANTKRATERAQRAEAALQKVRSYNVDIAARRINYRPHDHIQVIDEALTPTPENPNG